MKSYKDVEKELNDYKVSKKAFIKSKYTGFKRIIHLLWFNFIYVWKWLFTQFRDWHFIITFFIVMAVVGIEVWLPLVLGLIFKGTPFGAKCLYVSGICEAFWLAPLTPFIPLCIVITMSIQEIKIKAKRKKIILDQEIYDFSGENKK